MATSGFREDRGIVGIVGSGLIGRSWAMLFAAAGYKVRLYDVDPNQKLAAIGEILKQLRQLDELGLLRGKLSVEQQYQLISCSDSLNECVSDAIWVQECVPENHALKSQAFASIDQFVSEKAVLASSVSTMPASSFTEAMTHRGQVIVAHPTNPPFFCPLTEVVPAPYTYKWVTEKTMETLRELGQSPVLLKKEIDGFVLNRIQYNLLSECWRLVEDDVISATDLDKVMSDGLGIRYAFIGPFETTHLNAEGFFDYCDKYGETIHRVAASNGPTPLMSSKSETGRRIMAEMCKRVPEDQLHQRMQWRNVRLAALSRLKRQMNEASS